MSNGSGVSRGDRNRNARLTRLREAVPLSNAIVSIDLADRKQMVVVCDHDSKVLARRTFPCKAWDLGAALDWAGRAGVEGRVCRRDGGVRTHRSPGGGCWDNSQLNGGSRVCAAGIVVVGPLPRW